MSAAAVIAIRRKQLVRAFREAGATDSAHAVTLEQLGQRRSWRFDQMVARGVFHVVEADRYFMNEPAADAFLADRRRRALLIAGALVFVFLLLWLLGLMNR